MTLPYPETVAPDSSVADLFVKYLDGYRATVVGKLDGLSEEELRTAVLPSGWTPLELLRHLAAMERRWIQWDFLGTDLVDPWLEDDPETGRWHVPDAMSTEDVRRELEQVGDRTRETITGVDLATPGVVGGRFATEPAPNLAVILFHVLQEYARHTGHLDVVRELIDEQTGE